MKTYERYSQSNKYCHIYTSNQGHILIITVKLHILGRKCFRQYLIYFQDSCSSAIQPSLTILLLISPSFTFHCVFLNPKCGLTLCAWLQPGCVVTGPESRGGIYDHGYGCQSGCCGAALHLLHISQKVRITSPVGFFNSTSHSSYISPHSLHFLLSPPFFFREYDNLKGTLKSSNDMSEKLKREVLTTNNKVVLF